MKIRKIAGFYMKRFYALDNFAAFMVALWGIDFMTSEHAYQWRKFQYDDEQVKVMGPEEVKTLEVIREKIRTARSAHDAKQIARDNDHFKRPDWKKIKRSEMKLILEAKYDQHEYVRLTIERTVGLAIVETSHVDPEWGWGKDKNGENVLGQLWMEIRLNKIEAPVIDYRLAA